ncbi:MAG: hypothetical protein WBB37_03170 [bacterium]
MILMAEDDIKVRKKLCDVLHRERVIAVGSPERALEALVQHKGELKVIIANTRSVRGITSKDIIERLCKKLEIEVPPIIGVYRKGEEQMVKKIIEGRNDQKFVKYDEKDSNFPTKYIQAIKTQYSDLLIDDDSIDTDWAKGEEKQDIEHVRNWLSDEGFVRKPSIKVEDDKKMKDDKNVDYKKLYFEVKEKYDELLNYIHELTDTE